MLCATSLLLLVLLHECFGQSLGGFGSEDFEVFHTGNAKIDDVESEFNKKVDSLTTKVNRIEDKVDKLHNRFDDMEQTVILKFKMIDITLDEHSKSIKQLQNLFF